MRGMLIVAALAVSIASAAAQPAQNRGEDAVAAEALFAQGRTLMERKSYAEACIKFEASHNLEPSVGALLNLGECRQRLGQTATAWAVFRQAAALANKRADRAREKFALERAAELAPKLSYMLVEVSDASIAELVVKRNDEPVARSLWGQPTPVDPGRYVIRAEAPGRTQYEIPVEIAPGSGETRVTIPGLAVLPRLEPPSSLPPSAPVPVVDQQDTGERGGMPLGRKLALASGAAGLVGLVAGTVLGVQAASLWDDAEGTCMEGQHDQCSPDGVQRSTDALRKADQSTIAFGVGIAAAGAAVILWYVSSPVDLGTTDTARIEPMAGPGELGAQVHLRF